MEMIASRVSSSYDTSDMLQTAILTRILNQSLNNEVIKMQKLLEGNLQVVPSHLGQRIDIKA